MSRDEKDTTQINEKLGGKEREHEIQINKSLVLCKIWEKIDEIMYNRSKKLGEHWIKQRSDEIEKYREVIEIGNSGDKLNYLIRNAYDLYDHLIKNNSRERGLLAQRVDEEKNMAISDGNEVQGVKAHGKSNVLDRTYSNQDDSNEYAYDKNRFVGNSLPVSDENKKKQINEKLKKKFGNKLDNGVGNKNWEVEILNKKINKILWESNKNRVFNLLKTETAQIEKDFGRGKKGRTIGRLNRPEATFLKMGDKTTESSMDTTEQTTDENRGGGVKLQGAEHLRGGRQQNRDTGVRALIVRRLPEPLNHNSNRLYVNCSLTQSS